MYIYTYTYTYTCTYIHIYYQVLQHDYQVLLKTMSDNNRTETEAAITHCVTDIAARISGLEVSCSNTEKEVGNLNAKVDGMQAKQDKMQETLDLILANKMGTSASAPNLSAAGGNPNHSQGPSQSGGAMHIPIVSSPFVNSAFNRIPNPTKIFVNMKNKTNVSAKAFGEAFVALAIETHIQPDAFTIIGEALDNRFEVQFTCNTSAATRDCATFLASLSLGGAKYKPQFVKDDAGNQVQFFCNPDKNRAQVRREILCRNLKEILDPVVQPMGENIYVRKSTGSVMIDRKVLGTIFLMDENVAKVEWYPPSVTALSLDVAPIEAAFSAVAGGQACP